jgi:hypothetical protein
VQSLSRFRSDASFGRPYSAQTFLGLPPLLELVREGLAMGERGRHDTAMPRAMELCARNAALSAESSQQDPLDEPSWFRVTGWVDGEPVQVVWSRGRYHCGKALLDRAALVVAMGDEFTDGAERRITATLDDPLAALLTFIRACDKIEHVGLSQGVTRSAQG